MFGPFGSVCMNDSPSHRLEGSRVLPVLWDPEYRRVPTGWRWLHWLDGARCRLDFCATQKKNQQVLDPKSRRARCDFNRRLRVFTDLSWEALLLDGCRVWWKEKTCNPVVFLFLEKGSTWDSSDPAGFFQYVANCVPIEIRGWLSDLFLEKVKTF